MRRFWPFGRSTPSEPATPLPRPLDPRNLPSELPPEVAAFIRGPIDGRDDWLDAFLEEPELDNLRTFRTADDLTPLEAGRVRDIVATGAPHQARFNLLLNPQLVPEDIRLDALRAALDDADPYMRIAAAVGLQAPSNTPMTPASWPPTRDALIGRLDDPEPAIRTVRASLSLVGRRLATDRPSAPLRSTTTRPATC